jgi:hypothetical protein
MMMTWKPTMVAFKKRYAHNTAGLLLLLPPGAVGLQPTPVPRAPRATPPTVQAMASP